MDFHRHSRTPTLLPGNSPQDEFIPTPRWPAGGAFTSRLGAIRVDGMPVTESCRYPAFFDKFASQHVLSCVKEVKVTSSSRICRLNSRPFFARDELMIRRIYKTFNILCINLRYSTEVEYEFFRHFLARPKIETISRMFDEFLNLK